MTPATVTIPLAEWERARAERDDLRREVLSLRHERNALEARVKLLMHEVNGRRGDEATQAWLDAEQAAEDARNGGGHPISHHGGFGPCVDCRPERPSKGGGQ